MKIIGIDPGLSGGIGFVHYGLESFESWKMPVIRVGKKREIDIGSLLEILKDDYDLIVIEKVHAMPKQGVSSTFTFGMGYGILQGICATKGWPYVLVTPQAWKKVILAGTNKDKGAAISYINRMYPTLEYEGKRICDGQADALCLAEYGKREILK